MKTFFVLAFLTLVHTCLAEDAVDAFILSYLRTTGRERLAFDWSQADAVDRAELIKRLQEVVDGKRSTVGNGPAILSTGAGVGSTRAKIILVGIGEEDFIREEMNRWRTDEQRDAVIVRDLVDTGQVLGIPYLAVDLTSSPHFFYNGRVVEDGGYEGPSRFFAAFSIVGIAVYPGKLPGNVQASARAIQEHILDLRRKYAWTQPAQRNFVNAITQWWEQNKEAIEARQYAEVKPFPAPETIDEVPAENALGVSAAAGAAGPEPAPSTPAVPTPEVPASAVSTEEGPAEAASPDVGLRAWCLWAGGVVVLVGLAWMFLRRRL
jgi:hypothetical protein